MLVWLSRDSEGNLFLSANKPDYFWCRGGNTIDASPKIGVDSDWFQNVKNNQRVQANLVDLEQHETLVKLKDLIGRVIAQEESGYDALASHEWDCVKEFWKQNQEKLNAISS